MEPKAGALPVRTRAEAAAAAATSGSDTESIEGPSTGELTDDDLTDVQFMRRYGKSGPRTYDSATSRARYRRLRETPTYKKRWG